MNTFVTTFFSTRRVPIRVRITIKVNFLSRRFFLQNVTLIDFNQIFSTILGYIEFKRSMRFQYVNRLFNKKAWITSRRGTRDQARDYCMKSDTRVCGPFEYGDWRLGGAGTRTDLIAVTDRINAGGDEQDIASEFPVAYIKYTRGIINLINLHSNPRTQPPEVILCYGPTGTGKTKWCYDTHPLLYRKPCDTRWFDRYHGQEVLLLDDFGGKMSKMTLLYLLQLLDRYPLIVEAKGIYCEMMATTILITTNHHPRMWYDYDRREESYDALKRRIHKVYWFFEYGQKPLECDMDMFYSEFWEGRLPTTFCVPEVHDLTTEEESDDENQTGYAVIDCDEEGNELEPAHREEPVPLVAPFVPPRPLRK